MKILLISALSLMGMSFTNSSNVSILETENGTQIENSNLLSVEDINALEKMTVVGLKTTTAINKSVKSNWVNETVYKTTDAQLEVAQQNKLNSILAKY